MNSMKMCGLRHLAFLLMLISCSLGKSNAKENSNLSPIASLRSEKLEEPTCTCVDLYRCRSNTVNTADRGLPTSKARFLRTCQNQGEICCPVGDQISETGPIKPREKRSLGCGLRNPDGIGPRIGGGDDSNTEFGEFPWVVVVFLEDKDTNGQTIITYKCGGSLINAGVVLTAAHCVVASRDGKSFKIRAGEWDMESEDEIIPHQDRDVESVLIHDGYRPRTLHNDIALLFLKTPVVIAQNVDFGCLAPKGTTVTSGKCWASGWGQNVYGNQGILSTTLRKVEVPMVPHQKCEESLRKTRLGPAYKLHSSFVCAGGEPGKDTCQGDGGSPLMCPIPGTRDRYKQVGIVSWGIGCGNASIPGVYTNVVELRDWIDENMAKKQLGTNMYTY